MIFDILLFLIFIFENNFEIPGIFDGLSLKSSTFTKGQS